MKVVSGNTAHRVHELLEPPGIAVKLLEHGLSGVFDFILGLARPEPFGEVAPKPVKAGIDHIQEATHILGAVAVEEELRLLRITIQCLRAIALAVQKAERNQRVEKIWNCPAVQTKSIPQLVGGHGFGAECSEEPELHRRQQRLGRPETHANLLYAGRRQRFLRRFHVQCSFHWRCFNRWDATRYSTRQPLRSARVISFSDAHLNFFAARCSLRWPQRSSRAKRFFFEIEPKIWPHLPFLKMIW